MQASEVVDALRDLLSDAEDNDTLTDLGLDGLQVVTFAEAGLLTRDAGLVLRTADGEFQVTVVRSR